MAKERPESGRSSSKRNVALNFFGTARLMAFSAGPYFRFPYSLFYLFKVDTDNRNIRPLEQLRNQLDLLEDSRDTSSIIRILREQIEEMEQGNRMRKCDHHHHHHRQQQQQQKSSSSKCCSGEMRTEERGVQADWTLLMETEAELLGATQLQRLKAPDLTKTRQRTGSGSSRSHSADDDDDSDDVTGADDEATAERRHQAELKMADDRLLSSRLREANLLAHLKDYRARAEDLRRLIALRDGHIGRLEDEVARLKVALVEGRGKEKEMQSFISDLQLTLADLHAKYEEYVVLGQLRDSERTQLIDSLEKQVARLTEEKHALTAAHLVLGSNQHQQQQQHLSKSDSHFQSTGCLGPDESPVSQSSDKSCRGRRSVESSPSSSRCLHHDALTESSDPDAEKTSPVIVTGSSSTSTGKQKRSCSVVNGGQGSSKPSHSDRRSAPTRDGKPDAAVCDDQRPNATAAAAGDTPRRVGSGGGGPRANSIPRNRYNAADGATRTRSLVRKASYICGIQEHSMLDRPSTDDGPT